jgi:hypothetical protein
MTKLKANAGCAELPSVSITKDWFVRATRLPMQEGPEQFCRFGPQGTDPFLAALPEQPDVSRRLKVEMFCTNVQSFLDTRSGVVKEAQQCMVSLSQQSRLIGLRQDGRNLFLLQITDSSFRFFLRRDAKHLGTLSCRGWLAIGYKKKETSHCRKPTVTSGDRGSTPGFDVLKKRDHFSGSQIVERKFCNRTPGPVRREAKEQTPGIPIGEDRVARSIALLRQPVMKEPVEKRGKRIVHHDEISFPCG